MEALSSSMVIQHSHPLHRLNRRSSLFFTQFHKPTSQTHLSYSQRNLLRRRWCYTQLCFMKMNGREGEGEEEEENEENNNQRKDEEVDTALNMDGSISGSSNEFVERVSSRAYNMRRHLHQTFDTSSYDVLEANPWRDNSKPVYVLTHDENQLCTMKIRRPRSEVEGELGQLFASKADKFKNRDKESEEDSKFHMLVEDIREGVLVFEDANEAASYCDLLQGSGQECESVAEIEASWVFDLCQQSRALAVLFRRGRTPPLPENLKLNLRARQRSLED